MRIRTLWLSFAAILAAHAAAGAPAATPGTPMSPLAPTPVGGDRALQLYAPSENVPMIGGESAQLDLGTLSTYLDDPRVTEWEAFLSLDDGVTYPIRITPHLDRDLRRISWLVPELPTRTARLLLRFGDEKNETSVEIPRRFVILAAVNGPRLAASRSLVTPSYRVGESARPGDPGVVRWVEGSRQGGELVPVESVTPDLAERLRLPGAPQELDPRVLEPPDRSGKDRFAAAAERLAFVPGTSRPVPARPERPAYPPLSPLLQTLRLNQ